MTEAHRQKGDDLNQFKRGQHLAFYKSLVTVARYEPVDNSPLVPIEDIPWVDKSLIKNGLIFYFKHVNQTLVVSPLFMLVALAIKPISAVLLKGKLGDPDQQFRKYLLSVRMAGRFSQFYWDPVNAHKAFENVKKQHNLAVKRFNGKSSKSIQPTEDQKFSEKWKEDISVAVREELSHIDKLSVPNNLLTWKPPVVISQLDMVLGQLGVIWMFWGLPKLSGIRNRSEELKGVIHIWAIYGRMLGIKDEYNICIKPDPHLFELIARNFIFESLKNMDETVITAQTIFMKAIQARVPFMTYKGLLYMGFRELNEVEGKSLWKIMSSWDKASYRFLTAWMWFARQNFLFRLLLDIPSVLWLLYHLRQDVFVEMKRYWGVCKAFMWKIFDLTNIRNQYLKFAAHKSETTL